MNANTTITKAGLFGVLRRVTITITSESGFDFKAEQVVHPKAVAETVASILESAKAAKLAMGELDA